MTEFSPIPIISEELKCYWWQKYGENESIILIPYAERMYEQFAGTNIPYAFDPMIEFHLSEMHLIFTSLTKKSIKHAILSLRDQQVISWYDRKLEDCDHIWFINHEDLLNDIECFWEDSDV